MINLTLLTILFCLSIQLNKNTFSILVKVEGIQQNKGQIVIHLYTSKKGLPTKPEFSYKQFVTPIKNLISELLIENLPKGEYSISAFQDENLNEKLDVNFFNIPIEKVGCSNNPNAPFIPSYYDAKFKLSEPQLIKSITIK